MTALRDPAPAVPADARGAYEAMAPVYDTFTAHHRYEDWTRMIERIAAPFGLAGPGRLLDVGCGTGKSFLPWVARGWSVVGCDSSPAMLRRAAAKAPPEVRLVEADARRLGVLGRFDLVLALDDVVNYVPSPSLVAVFAGAARNLAPGGLLVFDLNTLLTYRTFFAATDVLDDGRTFMVWRGEGTRDVRPGASVDAVLDAFVAGDGGAWERRRSVHRQHHHPIPAVAAALGDAGLELCAARGQDEHCTVDPAVDERRHTKAIVVARRRRGEGAP